MTFKEYCKENRFSIPNFPKDGLLNLAIEAYAAYNAKAFFNNTMHQPEDSKEVDTLYDNFKFKKDQN